MKKMRQNGVFNIIIIERCFLRRDGDVKSCISLGISWFRDEMIDLFSAFYREV